MFILMSILNFMLNGVQDSGSGLTLFVQHICPKLLGHLPIVKATVRVTFISRFTRCFLIQSE